ncbi:MAG: DUF883 family protein [Alphaproteobacteria bacterium]|nr:DUF883 family protein [Alphaproteobacteria bacterium]
MATNGMNDQMQAIKADMAALRDDLAVLMKDMSSLRQAAGAQVHARVEETRADMAGSLESATHSVGRAAAEQVQTARRSVREHPLTSVAAAFGIGFLLARLVRD